LARSIISSLFLPTDSAEDPEITVRLLEEDSVLQFIFASQRVTQPEQIAQQIAPADYGSPGDWLLLYTDHGLFWAFYVILPGSGIPRAIAIFDALGIPISDKTTSDYLLQLLPELGDFSLLSLKSKPQPHQTSPTYGVKRRLCFL